MSVRATTLLSLTLLTLVLMTVPDRNTLAASLNVQRFGVYLCVTDLDRSRVFYERVLGKSPYVTNERLVAFDLAGGLFALYVQPAGTVLRGNNVVPYLRVQDIDGEFARMQTLGVTLLDKEVIAEGPVRLFRFQDPDGNVVELFSVTI